MLLSCFQFLLSSGVCTFRCCNAVQCSLHARNTSAHALAQHTYTLTLAQGHSFASEAEMSSSIRAYGSSSSSNNNNNNSNVSHARTDQWGNEGGGGADTGLVNRKGGGRMPVSEFQGGETDNYAGRAGVSTRKDS
eukprot:1140096-Pelagomonas_calceolata.AAC.2